MKEEQDHNFDEEQFEKELHASHTLDFLIIVAFVIASLLHENVVVSNIAVIVADIFVVGRIIYTGKYRHFAKATANRDRSISLMLNVVILFLSFWFIFGR